MLDRVGPYQIQGELGRGGMGVVYRATDERLNRTVAIKALPEDLGHHPDRLERFEREARTLASLNHANLAAIYGVEEQAQNRYLVLEFVDGETLAEILDRGPLDLDDAISIAVQIAAGVEAAHNAGVIHRDLKPANIKITPDGQAKVLDFGLAKADEGHSLSSPGSTGGSNLGNSQSPTLTSPSSTPLGRRSTTMTGMIMGTAAYMSPEQARGRPLDRRSDVWSFGVILYEMLTGASPFIGETATDSIGAVLHKNVDLTRLPPETPHAVRRVITRCLERDKADRWRDLGDARIELIHAGEPAEHGLAAGSRRNPTLVAAAAAVVALAGTAIGWAIARGVGVGAADTPADLFAPPALIVDLAAPEGFVIDRRSGPPRLSPDGTKLALVVRTRPDTPDGQPGPGRVCIKDLTTGRTDVYEETDSIFPTWSPDGRSVVYGANAVLTVRNVSTGRIEAVVGATGGYPRGVDWGLNNSVVAGSVNGIIRLDMTTGQPIEPLPAVISDESGGGMPAWPTLIDDGDHYLYSYTTAAELNGVYLASISEGSHTRLLALDDVQTRYLPAVGGGPGWLYYSHDRAIFRQPLDLNAGQLLGEPELLVQDAWTGPWSIAVPFDVGPDGRLVYYSDASAAYESELVVLTLETGTEEHTGVTGSLFAPSFSPDDRFVVLDITAPTTGGDIVYVDLDRGALPVAVASGLVNETYPHWVGPNYADIVYQRDGDLFLADRDGSRAPQALLEAPEKLVPLDVTPDGTAVLFIDTVNADGQQLHLLDLATLQRQPWLDIPLREGAFSPDGQWIAVVSGRPDRAQLELRRFPEGTGRIVLDTGGDPGSPVWSEDRSRIVYRKIDGMYAVDLRWPAAGSEAEPQPPTVSAPTKVMGSAISWRAFDLNADGTELVYIKRIDQTTGDSVRLIQADPPPLPEG